MEQEDLVDHLVRVSALPAPTASRLVAEVVHYFSESVEGFVRHRHRELQGLGLTKPRPSGNLRPSCPSDASALPR